MFLFAESADNFFRFERPIIIVFFFRSIKLYDELKSQE